MAKRSKAPSPAAAESAGAGDGVSVESPRRSERLQHARKRSRDASPRSPAPSLPRQARKRPRDGSSPSAPRKCDLEGSSADEVEAVLRSGTIFYLTAEEMLPYYKRLYKRRANLGLAWYHKHSPENHYEFTSVLMKEVCNFMDGCVSYIHMNFSARNVATRAEKRFFAELALKNDVRDENNGYTTTACSIIDDRCVGGMRHLQGDGLPKKHVDEDHCYACAEELKHPAGNSYEGGHYVEDYGVACSE